MDRPERVIAGSHDPHGGSPEARSGAIVRAIAKTGEDDLRTSVDGPLAVASRGAHAAGPPETSGPLCVLDGSIYNLAEVAEAAGVPSGDPPAVVLARAHDRLGERVVERLRGDFSLLLWDREAGRGLLARDQLGVRAIYWHTAGSRLLFATEIHYLLALLPRTPEPDPAAVAHWIALQGIPAERTPYAGVHRLPAGHMLRFEGERWALQRYWSPRYRRPLRAPRAELAEGLRALLEQAVARRCSPGETGVMLSGGLDSSTVAALLSREQDGGASPRAYSATFPQHPTIDESDLIAGLCDRVGLPCTQAVVRGGSVLAGALDYIDRWRVPPVSPNLFFWDRLLARASADGVRVLLDGEGGDEAFGLSAPLIADRLRRGRVLAARRLIYQMPGQPTRSSVRRIAREYGLSAALPPLAQRAARRLRDPLRDVPDWATPATAKALLTSEDPGGWKRARGPRWWAHLVENIASGTGAAHLYDHNRRRAARHGIEPRHPLVDVDVVEFILQLPPELAFDPRLSRPLLREATRGLLPDEIRLRATKSSFDAIFHEAMTGCDLGAIRAILGASDAEVGAFVDLAVVRERLLRSAPAMDGRGRMLWALQVWRLLTVECWLRMQADPRFADRLRARGDIAAPDCEVVDLRPAA